MVGTTGSECIAELCPNTELAQMSNCLAASYDAACPGGTYTELEVAADDSKVHPTRALLLHAC